MKSLLFIIVLSITMISCQEETSSDAKSKKSSSSSANDPYSEGEGVEYFKLINSTSDQLSHYLHAVGQSNSKEDCKITTTNGFTTSSPSEIDCYLEAEELDLYFNGASFTIASSANLCEYVAYVPFSFYQFLPGNSSRTVNIVECPADCGPAGTGDCTASSPNATCTYDYSIITEPYAGPNCDTGTLVINTTTYTYDSGSGSCSSSISTTETECGGSVYNCINGHRLEILDEAHAYELNETGGAAFDKTYKVSSPFSKGYGSNKYISNFTRMCGGPANNTIAGGYTGLYTYDGDQIDNYASGFTVGAVGGLVQYAEDAFQGAAGTSAYYAFYCLDQAYDVKARIRLMIRDWDKEFPLTTSSLELVSDISSNALMDASGDANIYNWFDEWNDRGDWDDFFDNTDNLDSTCSGFGANKYTNGAFPGYGL